MNIQLHIERLVLDGFDFSRAEAERVKGEFEAALTHLLSEGQLAADFSGGGRFPSLDLGALASTVSTPEALGRGIAQRVYGGIGKAE